MQVIATASVADNGVIGTRSGMLWHLDDDVKHRRRLTMGHVVLLGRRTYEVLGNKPLAGRRTIVLSRRGGYRPAGVQVARSFDEALALAQQTPDRICWVAGGGEVFRAAWPHLTGLEITEVHAHPEGEVTFPLIEADRWREIHRERHVGIEYVHYAPITRSARLMLYPLGMADAVPWRSGHTIAGLSEGQNLQEPDDTPAALEFNVMNWLVDGLGYWIARDASGRYVGVGGVRHRVHDAARVWSLYVHLSAGAGGQGYEREITNAAISQLAVIDPDATVQAVMLARDPVAAQLTDLGALSLTTQRSDDLGRWSWVYSAPVGDLVS